MDEDRAGIIDEITSVLREISGMRMRQIAPSWIALDLSMPQIKALWIVANNGRVTISEVSRNLHVGLSTASHLVDRLVQAGLVDREEDPDDRRRAVVQLSSKGAYTVEQLRQGNHEQMSAWLSSMNQDDLHALRRGLRALLEQAMQATDHRGMEQYPPAAGQRALVGLAT